MIASIIPPSSAWCSDGPGSNTSRPSTRLYRQLKHFCFIIQKRNRPLFPMAWLQPLNSLESLKKACCIVEQVMTLTKNVWKTDRQKSMDKWLPDQHKIQLYQERICIPTVWAIRNSTACLVYDMDILGPAFLRGKSGMITGKILTDDNRFISCAADPKCLMLKHWSNNPYIKTNLPVHSASFVWLINSIKAESASSL